MAKYCSSEMVIRTRTSILDVNEVCLYWRGMTFTKFDPIFRLLKSLSFIAAIFNKFDSFLILQFFYILFCYQRCICLFIMFNSNYILESLTSYYCSWFFIFSFTNHGLSYHHCTTVLIKSKFRKWNVAVNISKIDREAV